MDLYGIQIPITNIPKLDPNFIPIGRFNRAFLKAARKPLGIAVERADGQIARVDTFIHGTPDYAAADRYYLDRLVKTLLWMKGGFKVYVSGDRVMYEYLKAAFADGGSRDFDFHFMANVYERPFEVVYTEDLPREKDAPQAIGGHLEGCRIGFDAGGSDRKAAAVRDGEVLWTEEAVWAPGRQKDLAYHYREVRRALERAAAQLPRVDAVGISSAGIQINDRTGYASLFRAVPREDFLAEGRDLYLRAVRDAFGDVPCRVINAGDAAALAGAMALGQGRLLGVAMGTSQAGGFVDGELRITGRLNELAFVPVDLNPAAMVDEWSGDYGCGVKYFSQDCAIKLAPAAGVELAADATPAEKLKAVQKLMLENDPRARGIYESIGCYLAGGLALYAEFYDIKHVLLMGRVVSGEGGNIILAEAQRILAEDYPEAAGKMELHLPDENSRRVGQSVAAASLPEL